MVPRHLRFKVFTSDHNDFQEFMVPVFYHPEVVKSKFIYMLKENFPNTEFTVVPAGRNRFNVFPDLAHA